MPYPISVFTMDVSNSRKFNEPSKLTDYLDSLVAVLKDSFSTSRSAVRIKHRFGDEILVVAEGYSAAYVVAFYIRQIWKYNMHLPYFGGVIGNIDIPLGDIRDIDGWNHPLVWSSREILDTLKAQNASSRVWMKYATRNEHLKELVEDINLLLEIQNEFFKKQSQKEREVGLTFTVTDYQDYMARLFDKDPSTISRQVKSSRIELMLKINDSIIRKLTTEELVDERIEDELADEIAVTSNLKIDYKLNHWKNNWTEAILRKYLNDNINTVLKLTRNDD